MFSSTHFGKLPSNELHMLLMTFIIIKKDVLIVPWVQSSATKASSLPPSPPAPTHHIATRKDLVLTEAGDAHEVNASTKSHGRTDASYWMQLYTCIWKVDCVHPHAAKSLKENND